MSTISTKLIVGDPHGKVEDLDDMVALIGCVIEVGLNQQVDEVVFMGDQYHHHATIRAEVQNFWLDAVNRMRMAGLGRITMLVGNHDLAGNDDYHCHALRPLRYAGVEVVDDPVIHGGILYMPYRKEPVVFVEECRVSSTVTVLCHQEFDGSQYDNGFYIKGGVVADDIPQKHIISGHIHKPQINGPVHYVGSPRWQSLVDANADRGIWVMRFTDGVPVDQECFSTARACRPIVHVVWTPDSKPEIPVNAKVYLDVQGPREWIDDQVVGLDKTIKLRTFPTTTKISAVHESRGVEVELFRYLSECQFPNGSDKLLFDATLQGLMKDI